MTTARVPMKGASCSSCNAGLDSLIVGGVGDWRDKLYCKECRAVQAGLPPDAIASLVAAQYGISPERARAADATSQAEYEQITLGGPPYDDLPVILPTTRWHARRLA